MAPFFMNLKERQASQLVAPCISSYSEYLETLRNSKDSIITISANVRARFLVCKALSQRSFLFS